MTRRRNYVVLDPFRVAKLGLNPTLSILASYFASRISVVKNPFIVDGEPYYTCDYEYVAEYFPTIPTKVDTLRRLYSELQKKGLIRLMKIGEHICFTPSDFLRNWGYEITEDDALLKEGEKSGNVEFVANPPSGKFSAHAEKSSEDAEKFPDPAENFPLPYNIRIDKENNNNTNKDVEPKKSALPKKIKPSIISKAREVFEEYFEEVTEQTYYWEAKDAANMKGLLAKIKASCAAKGNKTDDDTIVENFRLFLHLIKGDWILSNLSVPNINSQYNSILSSIKNEYNRRHRTDKQDANRAAIEAAYNGFMSAANGTKEVDAEGVTPF